MVVSLKKWSFLFTTMLLIGIGACDLYAENWSVKQYSIADGLSNSHVTAVYQDSFGFIWIGTSDGLNRYDGYRFDVYRHNPVDSTSIAGNHIKCIVEDQQGDVWIGTSNSGIAIWNRKDGSFKNLGMTAEPFHSIKECGVGGMMVHDDNVWVKTKNHIFRVSQTLDDYEKFGHYSSVFRSCLDISYPMIMHDNCLWVGSKDGVHQFDLDSRIFNRITLGSEGQEREVSGLIQLNDSCLLLSTLSDISLYNVKRNRIQKIYANSSWNKGREINCLLKEQDCYWAGTSNGLMMSDSSLKGFKDVVLRHNSDEEIKHISSIMIDRSGLLWIGTKTDGLFKVDRKLPKFSSITSINSEFPLDSYDFKSIYIDEDNLIWLGTANRGIYCINRQKHYFKHYPVKPIYSFENDPAVLSILKDNTGNMWFGTAKGLCFLKLGRTNITEFDYVQSSEFRNLLTSNRINDMLQDQLGNIWFATQFGLYRYDGNNLTSFFADKDDETSLCNDNVNVLFEDDEGWIWIGTDNGVNIFDVAEENFTRIKNVEGEKLKISHNIVLSFSQDQESRVLIGTQSGLSYYDKKTRTAGFWPGNVELTTSKIYALEVDGYNRVWMSSGKGISYLIAGQAFLFNKKDGIFDHAFNKGASFNNNNKELLFAGNKGLTIIRPDSIKQNLIRPDVVVTGALFKHKGKLIEKFQGNIKELEIKYRRNSLLHVEFAAMEFTSPEHNFYQVCLDGFDDNWRPVTRENYVDFSNLPAGDYTLKIKGANSDFVWNNDVTELKITINSPLWMTNYAYVFYLMFCFFVIQTLINYRLRSYRRAYKDLQEKADDKRRIEVQKETLSLINQSLTDSISYAKRIQEAMLPSEKTVKDNFTEAFVYYRPKDIVSGDFYWTFKRDDKVFVAVVDCTGHGVPGAFMSIIGFDLLKNIIEIQGIECPMAVLNKLNVEVVKTFSSNGQTGQFKRDVNDGMDMALVVYDQSRGVLEFAGAKNPIYIVRDDEIIVYKGDRYPIGFKGETDQIFNKKEIQVNKSDIIYMFSDGYADQFGGPEGKKFKYRRFRHLLLNIHKLPVEDQKAILHQKIEEWMGEEHEQVDDMLLMGLKL